MTDDDARILLVDDQEDSLLALTAILKPLPAILVPVRSGEDALRALMTDEYAAILIDVVMPGMDGFETAYHVKRKDRTKDVPIIFLTAARDEPEMASRGCAAGAVDYLIKPFDPWVLRSKVELFIELHRHRLRLRRLEEGLRRTADRLTVLLGETDDDETKRALADLQEDITALRAEHETLPGQEA